MIRFIERHETKLLIVALLLLTVVIFHSEASAQGHVTAIDCGSGWKTIDIDTPEILDVFELVNNRVWTMPKNSPYKDGLTRPAFTLRYEDGSEMLVTMSGYLTVKPDSVSKGLLWYTGQPNWRAVGDSNPHPNEMYLLNPSDVVQIRAQC